MSDSTMPSSDEVMREIQGLPTVMAVCNGATDYQFLVLTRAVEGDEEAFALSVWGATGPLGDNDAELVVPIASREHLKALSSMFGGTAAILDNPGMVIEGEAN